MSKRSFSFIIGLFLFLSLAGAAFIFVAPYEWLDSDLRKLRTNIAGPPEWRAQDSAPHHSADSESDELFCDETRRPHRQAHFIEGIKVSASWECEPDSPWLVASSVLGTNRVSARTLMQSGLTPDAVIKGKDLDGDGDPDEIEITLEVIELNGFNTENGDVTVTYDIAPGVNPTAWAFVPKSFGMSTESFESDKAKHLMRLPAPVIRVEQGDSVSIKLENTHYLPHTIHLHGVDHPFMQADGTGNDGVPITSETPVMPATSKTYKFTPRQSGTMFYHCHVHPNAHILAGLQGMIIVEEPASDNHIQTLNVGGGHVRFSSKQVKQQFNHEFDLHYQDMDADLSTIMRSSNDPRKIMKGVHLDYDITNANMEYFLLNGKSFPYTFRESIVFIDEGEDVLLRVLNGGSTGIALHTHGHKATIVAEDGVTLPESQVHMRDVVDIAPAQRTDLKLSAKNDGLRSYGPGVWLFHDHHERGITTAGLSPGGNVSAIVYADYLDENGWPVTYGASWSKFFSAKYYQKKVPVWADYDPLGFFQFVDDSEIAEDVAVFVLSILFFLSFLFAAIILVRRARR